MGAERCIVLLVVVVMGTGLFMVNSVVDEDAFRKYSEEVADYNQLHDETLLDNVMHVRHPPKNDFDTNEFGRDQVKVKRSSGQGINEDPEHDNEESNLYEADLKDTHEQRTKSKRSSGQGIDEVPDHSRMARSSGQGINEDPEHDNEESNFYKADLKDTHEQHTISKRSSGQGIDEEKVNPQDDSLFSETASNLDDSLEDEDEGGVEKDAQFPNGKDESTFDADTQILEEIDSENVGEINGAMLADSKQSGMMMADDSILATEEVISQNGNHGDGLSHRDDIQNPYAHHYESGFDDDGSNDQPQIGYILYNSIYSANDDDKVIKLNKGVDFVLGLMNSMFTGEGQLTLDLPDINKKFGHGIMAGDFIGTQGYFRNPATLHRTGDVAITKIGDTVSLEVALGLGTLEAGFASYDLKILKIHQAGTIDISVGKNSLKMKISLTYAPACNLTVDYVELDQLEGIKVNITGLGAFQSMFDMLSKWFLDNFTVSFKDIVNQKLADKARKAVAREDICKYFPQ